MRTSLLHDVPRHTPAPADGTAAALVGREAGYHAYLMLRLAFAVAPIAFGLDKFVEVLSDNWEGYLANWVNEIVPGSAHDAMLMVGVIEIVAGVVVALAPKYGGLLVAVWLAGIIVNLLISGMHYDIALRDLGLCLGALALGRLATGLGKK